MLKAITQNDNKDYLKFPRNNLMQLRALLYYKYLYSALN